MTRVLQVDAKYGWIVEQNYYDANGQLLLVARASRHRFYPEDAVTMPHHLEVSVMPGQPTQMNFELDVSRYRFNRLTGPSSELFAMPEKDGYPAVDVADPRFRAPLANISPDRYPANWPPAQAMAPQVPSPYGLTTPRGDPQRVYSQPRTANLPVYRGYEGTYR